MLPYEISASVTCAIIAFQHKYSLRLYYGHLFDALHQVVPPLYRTVDKRAGVYRRRTNVRGSPTRGDTDVGRHRTVGGLRKAERCGIASARTGLPRYHGSYQGELGIIGGKNRWPQFFNVAPEQRMIYVSLDTFPPCCGSTVP